MTHPRLALWAALLAPFALPVPAAGQLVTVRYAGTVDAVDSGCDPPWDGVVVGDPWSVTFTYDTTTPDGNPAADRGSYVNSVPDFSLEVGPAAVSGGPGSSTIGTFDDVPAGIDQFELYLDLGNSYSLFLQLDGNAPVLSSDALPADCRELAPRLFDLATDGYVDDFDIFTCSVSVEIETFSCGGAGTSYQCYRAKDLKNPKFAKIPGVSLTDEVASTTVELKKLFQVCLPADRDGEGIPDPLNALCCYKQKAPKPKPAPERQTEDAFGTLDVRLKKPDTFCTPCLAKEPLFQ